jgi:hypothetical protein
VSTNSNRIGGANVLVLLSFEIANCRASGKKAANGRFRTEARQFGKAQIGVINPVKARHFAIFILHFSFCNSLVESAIPVVACPPSIIYFAALPSLRPDLE